MEKRKSDFNDKVWGNIKRPLSEEKMVNRGNKKTKMCSSKKDKSHEYVMTIMFALKIVCRVLTTLILWNLLVITGRML